MNQLRRFRKNKDVTSKKIKKAKSATLKLALIMLNFIFATFAWFTYTMILNPTVDVNVSAWKIDFKDDTATLGNSMSFEIGNFYPGIDEGNLSKKLDIINLGDRPASIEYQITSLKILGETYQIKESPQPEVPEDNTVYKSIENIYKLDANGNQITDNLGNPIIDKYVVKLLNDSNKYPFEILLTYSAQIEIPHPDYPEQNKGSFEIDFVWPYEITELPDDLAENLTEEEKTQKLEELNSIKTALDTKWGYDIASFYKGQQGQDEEKPGIEITLEVIAKQII